MSILEIDYRTIKIIPGGGTGKFTHEIRKGILPDSSKVWYIKEMKSPQEAHLEILAQEFLRLIIPNQPETRIAKHPVLNTYYVLSEEVPGYRNLPTYHQTKFTDGTYFGLGQITLLAAFLQNIDLKNGNVCLNDKNQVIGIDGDWAFVCIKNPSDYENEPRAITAELLRDLPYPHGIYTYNWLDIIEGEQSRGDGRIVEPALSNAPHFRNEVNQAILKILLSPDHYIENFVDTFIPVGSSADRFINYLQKRREELAAVAMKDKAFQDYLLSPAAQNDIRNHLIHMKNFVVNGTQSIILPKNYSALEKDYNILLTELRSSPQQQTAAVLAAEQKIQQVVKSIHDIRVVIDNKKTINDINDHRSFLLKQAQDLAENLEPNSTHGKSKLIQLDPFIKIALTCKQEQINEHADTQIKRVQEYDAAQLLIQRIADQINNIQVNFTDKKTLRDINEHKQSLLHQAQNLAKISGVNDENTLAHQVLKLNELHQDIHLALTHKQQEIHQQAMVLEERLDILSQVNFDAHVSIFMAKIGEVKIKAKTNPKYANVITETQKFCDLLTKAKKKFLHDNQPLAPAKKQLIDECQSAINQLRPEIQEHREWAGAIAKFIIDILSLLTFGLAKNQFSIFVRTDSIKNLDMFQESAVNALVMVNT